MLSSKTYLLRPNSSSFNSSSNYNNKIADRQLSTKCWEQCSSSLLLKVGNLVGGRTHLLEIIMCRGRLSRMLREGSSRVLVRRRLGVNLKISPLSISN